MATGLQTICVGEEFVSHAYLQCAIVSCIMLMFNGERPMRLDSAPEGTHPFPALRMDLWVKAYAERARLLSKDLKITPTEELTKRFADASFLAILKWMTRNQLPNIPQYNDFCKGVMSHPNYNSYMREVINLWSLEYQHARNSRKYGMPLSVLYFSDEFRAHVGTAVNHETQQDHVRHCFMAVQQKRTPNNGPHR